MALSQVKTQLAEKYERWARSAKSATKRRLFSNKARRYRQQVVVLNRLEK